MMLTEQLTFAQSIFNNRYDFLKGPEVFNSVMYDNTNFYLIGGVLDSTWYVGPTVNLMKIGVLKTDMSGNQIWKKKYGNDSLFYNVSGAHSTPTFYNNFYIFLKQLLI